MASTLLGDYLFHQLLSLAAPFSATTTQSTSCEILPVGEACVASKLWRSKSSSVLAIACSRGAALKCGSFDLENADDIIFPVAQILIYPMLDDRTCKIEHQTEHAIQKTWLGGQSTFGIAANPEMRPCPILPPPRDVRICPIYRRHGSWWKHWISSLTSVSSTSSAFESTACRLTSIKSEEDSMPLW